MGSGLSGCILGTEHPDAALEVPAAYAAAGRDPDAAVPAPDWWRGFRSQELTQLVEQARLSNLDIAVAVAQIIQADAQAGIAGAPLLPSLTGGASAERFRQRSALGGGASVSSQYNLGLTASYMLDFWGRNRATFFAAEKNAVASRYNREVVALSTVVSVANTYFQILAAQDELKAARDNLAASARILNLIQKQFAGGTASQLDVSQQSALVATVRASIPPLEVTRRQNIAALAVLVARAPADFHVNGQSLSRISVPRVTPGLPSELLVRRPDIAGGVRFQRRGGARGLPAPDRADRHDRLPERGPVFPVRPRGVVLYAGRQPHPAYPRRLCAEERVQAGEGRPASISPVVPQGGAVGIRRRGDGARRARADDDPDAAAR